jgi:transposase
MVGQVAPANQHDVTTALPLITEIPAVAGKPGPPKQKPEAVVADKAFDCKPLRRILAWLGIRTKIPRRGAEDHGLGKLRWFIERTLSWIHQFRRLRIRWDRNPKIHQAFFTLALALICFRIWSSGT